MRRENLVSISRHHGLTISPTPSAVSVSPVQQERNIDKETCRKPWSLRLPTLTPTIIWRAEGSTWAKLDGISDSLEASHTVAPQLSHLCNWRIELCVMLCFTSLSHTPVKERVKWLYSAMNMPSLSLKNSFKYATQCATEHSKSKPPCEETYDYQHNHSRNRGNHQFHHKNNHWSKRHVNISNDDMSLCIADECWHRSWHGRRATLIKQPRIFYQNTLRVLIALDMAVTT